jgi:outer membrane protein OmpA-like peptidoglycan-associated protein
VRVEAPPVVPAGEQLAPTPPAEPSAEPTENTFSPLLFAPNSAWLSPQADKSLAKLAALLKKDSTLRVRIHGHTDEFGPERFNELLSLKRAEQVRARLQDQGIGEERVDIKGFGSQQPADTSRTIKARARNRRVEITLY